MIFYKANKKMFYIGTIRFLLGIASPSLTTCAKHPVKNCIWVSKRAFDRDQRRAKIEECKNLEERTDAWEIVNDALGVKTIPELIAERMESDGDE